MLVTVLFGAQTHMTTPPTPPPPDPPTNGVAGRFLGENWPSANFPKDCWQGPPISDPPTLAPCIDRVIASERVRRCLPVPARVNAPGTPRFARDGRCAPAPRLATLVGKKRFGNFFRFFVGWENLAQPTKFWPKSLGFRKKRKFLQNFS